MRIASSPPIGGATDVEHWTGRSLADVAAECDQIRAQRGLPDVLLFALLDDIGEITERSSGFSCDYRRVVGLPVCGECGPCATFPDRHRESTRRSAQRSKERKKVA